MHTPSPIHTHTHTHTYTVCVMFVSIVQVKGKYVDQAQVRHIDYSILHNNRS